MSLFGLRVFNDISRRVLCIVSHLSSSSRMWKTMWTIRPMREKPQMKHHLKCCATKNALNMLRRQEETIQKTYWNIFVPSEPESVNRKKTTQTTRTNSNWTVFCSSKNNFGVNRVNYRQLDFSVIWYAANQEICSSIFLCFSSEICEWERATLTVHWNSRFVSLAETLFIKSPCHSHSSMNLSHKILLSAKRYQILAERAINKRWHRNYPVENVISSAATEY